MFATRPELRGSFGMVSSTHWLASATGMAVLERGGNAFDAAAAAGFPAVPRIGAAIGAVASLFRDEWPSSAEVWLAGGVPAPGARLRNPALAATWRRLLAEAEAPTSDRDGQIEAALGVFYEGFVAESIAGYLATAEVMDVSGHRHKGLLDGDDLH